MKISVESYQNTSRSLDAYWRSIILFGRNAASYKFALAKSLFILYLSFKYGDFQGYREGRYFSYIDETDIDFIIDSEKFRTVDLFYTKDKRPIEWINIILEKVNI